MGGRFKGGRGVARGGVEVGGGCGLTMTQMKTNLMDVRRRGDVGTRIVDDFKTERKDRFYY